MARDGQAPNQYSDQEPISKTSPDRALQEVYSYLHKAFPHGHPAFVDVILESLVLHDSKNQGYAGGGHPLGNFTRVARIMENYPGFPVNTPEGALIMFVMKHIDRVLWDMNRNMAPNDESCRDIAVYFNILRCMLRGEEAR